MDRQLDEERRIADEARRDAEEYFERQRRFDEEQAEEQQRIADEMFAAMEEAREAREADLEQRREDYANRWRYEADCKRQSAERLLATAPDVAVGLLEDSRREDPTNYLTYESLCRAYRLLHDEVALRSVMQVRVRILASMESPAASDYAALVPEVRDDREFFEQVRAQIRESAGQLAADSGSLRLLQVLLLHGCESEARLLIEALQHSAAAAKTFRAFLDVVAGEVQLRPVFTDALTGYVATSGQFDKDLFNDLFGRGWKQEARLLIEAIPPALVDTQALRGLINAVTREPELRSALSNALVGSAAASGRFDEGLFADFLKHGWKEEARRLAQTGPPNWITAQAFRDLVPLVAQEQDLRTILTNALLASKPTSGQLDYTVLKDLISAEWRSEAIEVARTYASQGTGMFGAVLLAAVVWQCSGKIETRHIAKQLESSGVGARQHVRGEYEKALRRAGEIAKPSRELQEAMTACLESRCRDWMITLSEEFREGAEASAQSTTAVSLLPALCRLAGVVAAFLFSYSIAASSVFGTGLLLAVVAWFVVGFAVRRGIYHKAFRREMDKRWLSELQDWRAVLPDATSLAPTEEPSGFEYAGTVVLGVFVVCVVLAIHSSEGKPTNRRPRSVPTASLTPAQQPRSRTPLTVAPPTHPQAVQAFNNGMRLLNAHNLDAAIAYLSEAIRLNPNYAEAYAGRASAHGNLGRHQQALEDYSAAARLNPGDATIRFGQGVAHENLGRYQEAIEGYTRAIQLKPDYAEALCGRADAYSRLGDATRAIQDYDETIRVNRDFAKAYLNRGMEYLRMKRAEGAITDFTEAIRLKPDTADTYVLRGLAYGLLGQPQNALGDFDLALRLNPNDPRYYCSRARAYMGLGQYQKAIADADQAIRLQPDFPLAHAVRRDILLRLGISQ